MALEVTFTIVSPQILPLGTRIVWLSGVRKVVFTRLMSSTLPVTPPALTVSPTSKGRYSRIMTPAAKLPMVSWSAKPTTKPTTPKPARNGPMEMPTVPRASRRPRNRTTRRVVLTAKRVSRSDTLMRERWSARRMRPSAMPATSFVSSISPMKTTTLVSSPSPFAASQASTCFSRVVR